MKENNQEIKTNINPEPKIEINEEKLGKEKTTLSDWQMYQLAISGVAFRVMTLEYLFSLIPEDQRDCFQLFQSSYVPCIAVSELLCEENYSYEVFFSKTENQQRDDYGYPIEISDYKKNQLVINWLFKRQIIAKHLHRVLQIINDYDDYFFVQGTSCLSLHFDALETTCGKNTIIVDFDRDNLYDHIDKKRIVSRYQTLSFYDYDYFYKNEAPNQIAVDFWLAMDRFLEEPYLTQQSLFANNSELNYEEQIQKRYENANKKDKLRNYVHRIMIVPDKLLNDNEKKFRDWVRNPDNQKKFIKIYQNTFNRVEETGLKKIKGNIEDQKKNIKSKLLFCKQKMTVTNLDGTKETKFVYSLKLLEDGQWIEYPEYKYEKYSKVYVHNPQRGVYDTKNLDYALNDPEELYEFPNMEYLTYLLHADSKELSEIEKEFVDAFLDRSASGIFSLGVRMHTENVKQYVHDNLITRRENWKLRENGLSDEDIEILNILNDDDRINKFNKSFSEIYNADLVKNLWDKAQLDFDWLKFLKFLSVTFVFATRIFLALKLIFDVVAIWALITFPIAPILIFLVCTFVFRNKFCLINRYFDAPTDKSEQYDIAREIYKTLQRCNKKEIKEIDDKDKLPNFNWHRFLKFLAVALVLSLLIFLALKFIFNVAAIWPLIIFPVIPVLIFLVYTFFVKNKFIYYNEVRMPKSENSEELLFSDQIIKSKTEGKNHAKYDKEKIRINTK